MIMSARHEPPGSSRELGTLELRDREGLNLSPRNVKVLIDSFDDGPEILRQMWEFIRDRRAGLIKLDTPVTDLLIYYVGHGGFSENDAFFLSIRSTNENDPLATSITAESLGRLVREAGAGLRTYLVLDCCFAASVSKVFMNGPLGVAEAQLRDVLPQQGDVAGRRSGNLPAYGTALLCASGPREPAKAPPDLAYTMFTGALLELLRTGETNAPPRLSLDDAARLVRMRLEAQFTDKAVLPVVHAPQQSQGRLDLLPLFPNAARRDAYVDEHVVTTHGHAPFPIPESPVRGQTITDIAMATVETADVEPKTGLAPPQHGAIVWLARWPLLAWGISLAVTGALFLEAFQSLGSSSEEVFSDMSAAPLTHMPEIESPSNSIGPAPPAR